MGSHDPFKHLKHKLWPKERSGVKLPIWFPTIKIQESPQLLTCRWCATYHWKALEEDYNFAWNFISIRVLHTKLWGPKVTRVLTLGISRLPFGSPRTKCHLDVSLMKRHRIYYKGEGGGFPQVQAVVSLVNLSLPVAHLSIKSAPTMH